MFQNLEGYCSERAEVFMAITRAQVQKEAKAERDSLVKKLRSGVRPNPILLDEPQEETWNLGEELNDTIVHCGRDKLVQSRSGKEGGCTEQRYAHNHLYACRYICGGDENSPRNRSYIRSESYGRKESASGVSFVIKDGLMYRVVVMLLGGDSEPYARDQLVLTSRCRSVVMELAHSIPCIGHQDI